MELNIFFLPAKAKVHSVYQLHENKILDIETRCKTYGCSVSARILVLASLSLPSETFFSMSEGHAFVRQVDLRKLHLSATGQRLGSTGLTYDVVSDAARAAFQT